MFLWQEAKAKVCDKVCQLHDDDDNDDDCTYPRGKQYLQRLVGEDEQITHSSLDRKTHIQYAVYIIIETPGAS